MRIFNKEHIRHNIPMFYGTISPFAEYQHPHVLYNNIRMFLYTKNRFLTDKKPSPYLSEVYLIIYL